MTRSLENPDRNFFADGDADEILAALKHALHHTEPASPFSEADKIRIGKIISGAMLKTKRQSH